MISVSFTCQNHFQPAVVPLFYHSPHSLVGNKKYEHQCSDQPEAAEIPGDECSVVWVVFYRKYMCERRFLVIGKPPLVSGFRCSNRNIFGNLRRKCEHARFCASG